MINRRFLMRIISLTVEELMRLGVNFNSTHVTIKDIARVVWEVLEDNEKDETV